MKSLRSRLILGIVLTSAWLTSCSSDDADNPGDPPSNGSSFINYSVSGSALNDTFSIEYPSEDSSGTTTVLGHVYNEDTNEGTVKVVSLIFSFFVSDNDYYDVAMFLPAQTGSFTLGEFETTSTGVITVEPTYNMVLSFDPQRAYYNNGSSSGNTILTDLLSKNIVVTITEYEEITNSLGIVTLGHIKGSIGASGNQGFFKSYTGPTSEPEELLHNITADFEYNIQ